MVKWGFPNSMCNRTIYSSPRHAFRFIYQYRHAPLFIPVPSLISTPLPEIRYVVSRDSILPPPHYHHLAHLPPAILRAIVVVCLATNQAVLEGDRRTISVCWNCRWRSQSKWSKRYCRNRYKSDCPAKCHGRDSEIQPEDVGAINRRGWRWTGWSRAPTTWSSVEQRRGEYDGTNW